MSTFNYTALDNLGKKKKGVLSAQSEREARKFIKDLNLTPITVTQSEGTRGIKSKVSKLALHNSFEVAKSKTPPVFSLSNN